MSSPQKRHYRYHGITASHLPSPRYYRESFLIPAVITVVTAVLLLSPIPCHPLIASILPWKTFEGRIQEISQKGA